MKKMMWFLAIIPVIVTSIVLPFMPDTIPMHHDLAGNIDRWGSKTECFVFPVIILFITLFWHLLMRAFEKKAAKGKSEKEQMEGASNAKFLGIVGIAQALMFGCMHYFILYSSFKEAELGSSGAVDIAKVSCVLCGLLFIVLGNFMTKTKKNGVAGVRTSWSMYNDVTWRKSNRIGAYCFMIAGILTVITTAFLDGVVSTVLMLIYVLIAAAVAVVYTKKVYEQEKEKN